jgi:hypothetical protein
MVGRTWVIATGLIVLVAGGLAGAALLAWPHGRLDLTGNALASIELPRFAGTPAAVRVTAADGRRIPVALENGELWPRRPLDAGERLTVAVTMRRPSWAGWLVGHTSTETFAIITPTAHVRNRWLQIKPGADVTVAFDQPVGVVQLGGKRLRFPKPRSVVPVGVVANGPDQAGATEVAVAARSWERLSKPVRVSWFPKQPYTQLLSLPRNGAALKPDGELTLGFSAPVQTVIGSARPRLDPPTPGRWRLVDAHTLVFKPSGLGFPIGTSVDVVLPRAVHLVGPEETTAVRTLSWPTAPGSTLRLQQLLAQLGYLPLDWQPAADPPTESVAAQLEAAVSPPPGNFTWRYPNTPPELHALWTPGQVNQITRGAVMMFEDTHGLDVDALAGPRVWHALMLDALRGKRRDTGYSYVFVHRDVPQSLHLWHNGQQVLTSPGNTGVPAAPTELGTWPVFEHIPVGTMSGTNPDGSHYNDPGIRWISYFHGGEALHAFNRSSFGTPQSLGCVELPLASAAKVWPYTPIGTLVTIEH